MSSGGKRCRPSSSIVFCLACLHADFSIRFKSLRCRFESSWAWGLVVRISWSGLEISSGRSLGVLSALGVPSAEITSSTPILEAILEAFWVAKSAYEASVLGSVGLKASETVLNAKICKKRAKK